LLPFDDGVDDSVQEALGASIAQVQDSLPPEAVMDRKTNPDQRHLPAPGQVIAFAVADEQVRGQSFGGRGDLIEIGPFQNQGWAPPRLAVQIIKDRTAVGGFYKNYREGNRVANNWAARIWPLAAATPTPRWV